VQGSEINYTKIGSGSDVIFLFASIHGCERTGKRLLERFEKYIIENDELAKDKTIIIMPVANPDGYEKNSRYNINKVDLNRNFPAANRVANEHSGGFALSEPESYALYKIVNIYKPSRIIALHEALACIDYNAAADELAKRLAAKCKLPLHQIGAMPGSLGSYAGEDLKIPIITVEFTKEDSKKSQQRLWSDYSQMLIESVR
jgi:protein MpaA